MFDRGMNHSPRDQYTDAVVNFVKALQTSDGSWKTADGRRPPMNSGDLQTTALAIYALKNFTPAPDRAETDAALARAAAWLTRAQPVTTQERAFHLMALAWSNASAATIERAAHALAAT